MAFAANPLMDLRVTLQNMSSLSSLKKRRAPQLNKSNVLFHKVRKRKQMVL